MTTTKTPQTEANELVEMFRPYAHSIDVNDGFAGTDNKLWEQSCISCAILHVEGLIEVLGNFSDQLTGEYYRHYKQVLKILKDKK